MYNACKGFGLKNFAGIFEFSTLVQLQIRVFVISLSLTDPFVDLTYNKTEIISFLNQKM